MVDYYSEQVDHVFHALANSTRRRIMAQLCQQDMLVTEIAAHHEMSLPGVSKHLQVLSQAGLITQIKQGRERYCRAQPEQLVMVSGLVKYYTQFWNKQLDQLESFLKNKE